MDTLTNFSILRQAGTSRVEERLVMQYAMTSDFPVQSARAESIGAHAEALRAGTMVPVGSVEFVRAAMALTGIREPANMTYPAALRSYLHRTVELRTAGSVLGYYFIKPATTKLFTGFVIDSSGNPDRLSLHDREQSNTFLSLEPETPVWVSEPVSWLCEVRYYVIDGRVCGMGRYDDGPDDAPYPDDLEVANMATQMASVPNAPAAFSIDAGVLDSGQTALIECNDAWALGFYRGTLSQRDYLTMLCRRWQQLVGSRSIDHQ